MISYIIYNNLDILILIPIIIIFIYSLNRGLKDSKDKDKINKPSLDNNIELYENNMSEGINIKK